MVNDLSTLTIVDDPIGGKVTGSRCLRLAASSSLPDDATMG